MGVGDGKHIHGIHGLCFFTGQHTVLAFVLTGSTVHEFGSSVFAYIRLLGIYIHSSRTLIEWNAGAACGSTWTRCMGSGRLTRRWCLWGPRAALCFAQPPTMHPGMQ
jgi:hypothetical protein